MTNEPTIYKSEIKDMKFGKNVIVVEPINIYGSSIDDNTFVGPFVEIQKNVKIGKNCKIQSHSFICELVNIGNNTVIAHNVSIGTNATILPVTICDKVVIGAGSVVTKNINEPGIYAGNPAKKIRNI